MAQITKIDIRLENGDLIHSITSPPFDKWEHPGLPEGTHQIYYETYVDGELVDTSETSTIISYITPVKGVVNDYPMNETSGDMVDTINGLNGTVDAGVTRDGAMYTFSGGAGVSIPDSDLHTFLKSFEGKTFRIPFTIRMLIKLSDLTTNQWFLNRRTSTLKEVQLYLNSGAVKFDIMGNDDGNMGRGISTSKFTADQIHHLVITHDGSNRRTGIRMYLDKVREDTVDSTNAVNTTYANTTQPTLLGKAGWTTSYPSNGVGMSNLRIHKGYQWSLEDVQKDFDKIMAI